MSEQFDAVIPRSRRNDEKEANESKTGGDRRENLESEEFRSFPSLIQEVGDVRIN